MKRLLSFILLSVAVFGWGTSSAQCSINISNTTPGFTPNPAPPITQGVLYTQAVQVYVPTTLSIATIDSVHISSIGGLPAGISYIFNPVDGGGGTVNGGANGAICFSGTTSAAVGNYPLTFNGTAYTNAGPFSLSQPPASTQFTYSFTVQAPAISGCDTLTNVSFSGGDTPTYYGWNPASGVGFISGNGAIKNGANYFAQTALAEKFTTSVGNHVQHTFIFPSYTTINAADSAKTVTVYVYDNSGTALVGPAGAPGVALDSSSITLKELATAVTSVYAHGSLVPVQIDFPHQPALTGTDFFIVVSLPQTTGDTLVVFTNSGRTLNGHAWLGLAPGWVADDSLIHRDLGYYIAAIACPSQNLPPLAAYTASSVTVCANATITFTDNSTQSPLAWGWDFGDGTTSTVQSPTHAYVTAGTYTVIEYAGNSNGQTETSTVITVNANPSATAATSANAASLTVTGGALPYSFAWSNGGTADSIAHVAIGYYNVTITDNNGCQKVLDSVHVTVTGILELTNGQQVKIYPNPATDVLNLVWSQKSNAEVSVLDLNGNVVRTFVTFGDMQNAYNIHELASGAYIIRITDKTTNQQQSMLFSKF